MSVYVFCSFLNWIFFSVELYKLLIYILDTNPVSDMSFANIFSHSAGYLSVLLVVFFALQKLFILM